MTIMELHYQKFAEILPEDERYEIELDQLLDMIIISTDDVIIHSDTAAKIYDYCARHSLRCYISWSDVSKRIRLAISKKI